MKKGQRKTKLKQVCIHGHAMTLENTRVRITRNGHIQRNCRQCHNIRSKRYYAELFHNG